MPECFGSSLPLCQVHNLSAEVSNSSYKFLFYGVASKKQAKGMYTHSTKKEKEIYDEVSLRFLASS